MRDTLILSRAEMDRRAARCRDRHSVESAASLISLVRLGDPDFTALADSALTALAALANAINLRIETP